MSTALLDDSAATSSIDMTYWEALRSYWRICWPALLLGLVAYFPFILIAVRGRIFTLHLTPLGHVLALVVLGALGFLMYLGRILSPFPRFSIQIVASPPGIDRVDDAAPNATLALRRVAANRWLDCGAAHVGTNECPPQPDRPTCNTRSWPFLHTYSTQPGFCGRSDRDKNADRPRLLRF